MGSYFDLSQQAIVSIDTLLDQVIDARTRSGIPGQPELAVFDKDTGRKFRRFQKKSDEEEMAYRAAIAERQGRSKSSAQSDSDQKLKSIWGWRAAETLLGTEDDGYDTAPPYICEYCSKIGRNKKYVPVICDNCSDCVSCEQFLRKECSACEYSRWREGVPYGKLNSGAITMTVDDRIIMDEVRTSMRTADDTVKEFPKLRMTGWGVNDV